jgi:hypothetical protein
MDGVAGVLTPFSFLHTVGSLICFPFVLLQAKYSDLMAQYSQLALRAKVDGDYPQGCACKCPSTTFTFEIA